MLKMFLGVLVSVAVLLSSVYVPYAPAAYATSADVLITQVQAGGVGAATQEFIVLYNNSPVEVDITGWCLTNKNSATIACFGLGIGQTLYLPAYKYAVAVSSAYVTNSATVTYAPISQSSGSLIGSTDKVLLVDHTGRIVDQHTWTSSISGGMQFMRASTAMYPTVYQDTDTADDWAVMATTAIPSDETRIEEVMFDVCSNIEGAQSVVPEGSKQNGAGECVEQIIATLYITEILPNANGSDVGQEFIELYNPNDFPINLSGYVLYVGLQYEEEYPFPTDVIIEPFSYKTFSNTDIPYSLLNTSSRVALVSNEGIVISEVPAYESPKDGQSWVFINEVWRYSTQPTPGSGNRTDEEGLVDGAETTLQPCAVNQYRSLETNRCRLLATATATATPCKDGQYRSEETNRCRNIATDVKVITPCDDGEERNLETNRCRKIVTATEPAACKEGQERNPETNRCRTVAKMSSADYGVLGAETKNSGNWYVFAAVGGVLLLALAYAAWEWHDEIGKFVRKIRRHVIRFVRLHK